MANAVFITVVLLRFFVPLFIPRFPLPAILACLVLDAADQTIFQAFTDDPLPGYQSYDKALDVYYLAIAYISTMRNWTDPSAYQISKFLYFYRLVGVTAFELLDQRWLLLVFPNTFEYFFIAYEAIRTRWDPNRLSARRLVKIAAFIWIFIKLPQEWWIHIAKLDFTEFMADHSYMWGVLAALVVIAAGLIWHYRSRIPAPDWRFAVDINAHLDTRRDPAPVAAERFFSWVLFQKVALLALLSIIFAQVLPDVRASNLGIVLGVTGLVVVNAAVTQWLVRRGRTWATTAREFVAMLLINTAIVTIDSVFGSSTAGNAPKVNALFFVLLLSLMIALFDRFLATRHGIDEGPGLLAVMKAEKVNSATN
jgi:hypothetical protein